jgi:uncharacterized protein YndB with AHSA1/START domain
VSSAVIVSLRVKASPREAFDIFTREIAAWWRPGQLFRLTPRGDGELRFEPGVGGRLVSQFPSGESFEVGRITAWAPGERLAFSWRQASFAPDQSTHVEVRFEAVGEETRVSVEHRGWDAIPQQHAARHGFPLGVFQLRQAEHWRALLASFAMRVL